MAAYSDYELIAASVGFTLAHAEQVEADAIEALQTSGATYYVNTLRTLTMQSAIVAIGSLQVFEGTLQQLTGWKDTFLELDKRLRAPGHSDLADRFRDYRDAVNVLKHGEGRSYESLLKRKDALLFTIKDKGQPFFDEGDVSEGVHLIKADHEFVRQCSAIIQEVAAVLDGVCPAETRT